MMGLWWAQIKAVIRLEMRKTFFAKRALWIYALALLPLVLFIVHAIESSHERRLRTQTETSLTYQDLAAMRLGLTREEVLQKLGKPASHSSWNEAKQAAGSRPETVLHESYSYSDGSDELVVDLEEGKVIQLRLGSDYNLGQESIVFAGVFQFFYLRLAIFFGCLGIFMNLFRGEVLDKSLHFYFLAPIRREVLMLGKFLAGLLAATVIFTTSELLQNIVFAWHFSPPVRDLYLYHHHGLAHAVIYLGVTALACLGYGTFFLAAGMHFRNPLLPAAVVLIWEAMNPFLPSLLQKLSVIYYLKSLCPVNIPVPPGAPPLVSLVIFTSDPISAPMAVLGVVTVGLLILYIAGLQVRRMEINYTID